MQVPLEQQPMCFTHRQGDSSGTEKKQNAIGLRRPMLINAVTAAQCMYVFVARSTAFGLQGSGNSYSRWPIGNTHWEPDGVRAECAPGERFPMPENVRCLLQLVILIRACQHGDKGIIALLMITLNLSYVSIDKEIGQCRP